MIEYRVREVKRYIVTRFQPDPAPDLPGPIYHKQGSTNHGEFDNKDTAYEVGIALAFKEREDLGWPPGDERMIFPDQHRKEG
jgi:hypothetical protein